jgi:hypothetical protein
VAKTVIVKLTDDLDGSDADETVRFALDGTSYEIDLNAANAAKLRGALEPFVARAVRPGRASRNGAAAERPVTAPRPATLFSELTDEEKVSFRAWANLPAARRIADARVRAWMEAGRV